MAQTYDDCDKVSTFVRQSLLDAGFLINEDKSIFKPAQSLEWLGIIWDTHNFTLCIAGRRIDDLSLCIENLINKFPFFTERQLSPGDR